MGSSSYQLALLAVPSGLQNGVRTKPQWTKSQPEKTPMGKIQTSDFRLSYNTIHACMVQSHSSCIHTYCHHAELLDAPHTIMLFLFILLVTETLIVTIRCQSGICILLK